jgi:hypothetical protein
MRRSKKIERDTKEERSPRFMEDDQECCGTKEGFVWIEA